MVVMEVMVPRDSSKKHPRKSRYIGTVNNMEHETTIRRINERYWVKYKTLCSPEGVLIWFYSLFDAIEYVELHDL